MRTKERRKPPRKFEEDEMQALLGGDDGQTSEKFPKQLKVEQPAVARPLKAIERSLAVGRLVVSHSLTERRGDTKNH